MRLVFFTTLICFNKLNYEFQLEKSVAYISGQLKVFPKVFLILSTSHSVLLFSFRIDRQHTCMNDILRLILLYPLQLFALKIKQAETNQPTMSHWVKDLSRAIILCNCPQENVLKYETTCFLDSSLHKWLVFSFYSCFSFVKS